MADLPSLMAKVELDEGPFDRGIESIGKKVEKLNRKMEAAFSTLESLGKKAVIGFGAASAAVGGALFMTGKLESSMIQLEAVTQGNVEAFNLLEASVKRLNRVSADNEMKIRSVTASAYGMMKQFNMTAEQTAELVERAEAMSSLWGTDFQSMTHDFMMGLQGMGRGLRIYGIDLDDLAVKQWLLNKGLDGQYERMTEMEKANIRFQMIMEATAGAVDGADKAGRSFSETLTRLKESALELVAKIGLNWFEEAKNTMYALAEIIERAAESPAFARLAKNIVQLTLLITSVGVVLGVLGKIGMITMTIISAAFGLMTNPLFLIVAATTLLIANFDEIVEVGGKVLDFFKDLWIEADPGRLTEDWNSFVDAIKSGDWFGAVNAGIRIVFDAAKWVWSGIEYLYNEFMSVAGEDIKTDWDALKAAFQAGDFLGIATAVGKLAVDITWGVVSVIGKTISDLANVDLEEVRTAIDTDFSELKSAIETGDLLGILRASGKIFADIVWGAISFLGQFLSGLVGQDETIKAAIDEDFSTLRKAIERGDILEAFKASGRIVVDIAWGALTFLGKLLELIPGVDTSQLRERIDLGMEGIRTSIETGDIIGVLKATGTLAADIVWGGITVAGEAIKNFSVWLKNRVEDLIYGRNVLRGIGAMRRPMSGGSALDVGFFDLVVQAGARVLDFVWSGIVMAANAIAGAISKLSDWVRDRLGIRNSEIHTDLGSDLTVILAGAITGVNFGLEWLTTGMSGFNEQIRKAIDWLKEVRRSETDLLEASPDLSALSASLKEFGRNLAEFIIEGFKTAFNLLELVQTAIEKAVTGLTGSELLGMTVGKAVPLYFVARMTGLTNIVQGITSSLIMAGLMRGGGLGSIIATGVGGAIWTLGLMLTIDTIKEAVNGGLSVAKAMEKLLGAAGFAVIAGAVAGPVGAAIAYSAVLLLEPIIGAIKQQWDKWLGEQDPFWQNFLGGSFYSMPEELWEDPGKILERNKNQGGGGGFGSTNPFAPMQMNRLGNTLDGMYTLDLSAGFPVTGMNIVKTPTQMTEDFLAYLQKMLEEAVEYVEGQLEVPRATIEPISLPVDLTEDAVSTVQKTWEEVDNRIREGLTSVKQASREDIWKGREEISKLPDLLGTKGDYTPVLLSKSEIEEYTQGLVDSVVLSALSKAESSGGRFDLVGTPSGYGPFQFEPSAYLQAIKLGMSDIMSHTVAATDAVWATQAAELTIDWMARHGLPTLKGQIIGWNIGRGAAIEWEKAGADITALTRPTRGLLTRFMIELEKELGGDWSRLPKDSFDQFVEVAETVNEIIDLFPKEIEPWFGGANKVHKFELVEEVASVIEDAVSRVQVDQTAPEETAPTVDLDRIAAALQEIAELVRTKDLSVTVTERTVDTLILESFLNELKDLNSTASSIFNRLAIIRDQLWQMGKGFSSGGYTGSAGSNEIAGVVHGGEWVAPEWLVSSMPGLFGRLEEMRKKRTASTPALKGVRGYQLGGFVTGLESFDIDSAVESLVDMIEPMALSLTRMMKSVLSIVVKIADVIIGATGKILEAFGLDSSFVDIIKDSLGNIETMVAEIEVDLLQTFEDLKKKADEIKDSVEESVPRPEEEAGGFFTLLGRNLKGSDLGRAMTDLIYRSRELETVVQGVSSALASGDWAAAGAGIDYLITGLAGLMGSVESFLTALGPAGIVIGLFLAWLGIAAAGLMKLFRVAEGISEGINKTLSPALERLRRPFVILGAELGRVLIPVVQALVPVAIALANTLKNVINFVIDAINTAISIINLLPMINIPLLSKIGETRFGSEEDSMSNTAGWHQPVTNNFNVTFTGNTILDTDDEAMKVLWEKFLRYAREHGQEVIV